MNYLVHYYVRPYNGKIIGFLEKLDIQCSISPAHGTGDSGFITFKVYDDNPLFNEIKEAFYNRTVEFFNVSRECISINTIYYPCYTEAERCGAKWLDIRAITTKIDPANDEDVSRVTCVFGHSRSGTDIGHHRVQAKPVELRRTFKWGNNQFFSGSITTGGLFCSSRAVSIMEHAGLQGLQYGPVLKWRTSTPILNVHQILPEYVIPNGAFSPIRDMESYVCEMCGMQMLRISGKKHLYAVRDSYFDPAMDFFKTLPLFLDYSARGYSGGKVHYILSQRAYQVLKENRMCRGVEFTPLTSVP